MNLGLVHPYIYYLNIFIFTIFISGWLLSFLKIESLIINAILISANYIGIISLSILNSIFIIFFFSAGYLMNIDLAISVLMIGLYVYLANEFINLWRVLFKEHDDFLSEAQIEIKYKMLRKLPAIAIIAPFVISFIIFYSLFYGDNIYKISPHCENTNDPKIKICKYSKGKYTGEMKAFRRHGQGEYISYSGKTFKGEWIEGKSVR
tara:strand:+ start:2155 stop:2772 length:618 start_codon:yes stop_codon:yes gene_type:complete